MYLKSIEIHGFKSFANRIRFEFHNGITGIVGPNGSGKSNVADAVRWVLGEQSSRQLRGSSMQDVIFSGTEVRKPMGFAYVAITLDNSDHSLDIDFEEVTVARRLYRSGESEYLINGSQVRLKDVAELFYDTGIGKEGYSIIGQGQIDKILSDKPEDRRELFDEAAGIVKFKRRKEATVRKLNAEQENLVRVNDILSELEHRVGPLKEQSEKATEYLNAREQLKKLEINVFLEENGDIGRQLSGAETAAAAAADDLAKAKAESETIRQAYDAAQEESERLDAVIEEARTSIAKTNVTRTNLEGNIRVYEEQIRAAKKESEHFRSRVESLKTELSAKSAEKERAEASGRETAAKIESLTAQSADAREALAAVQTNESSARETLEDLRKGILDALGERAGIRSRMAAIQTKQEQITIRKAELTSRLVAAQTEESRQGELIAAAEKRFAEISGQVAKGQARRKEIETALAGIKPRLAGQDEILRNAQIAYHQAESQAETLRNLTERYEGFGGSVRRVMQEKKSESGLIGVVADLLKTEERYEAAIEAALGGSIQNVVTEEEGTAKRMIEMLKREKAGRVTFLPLTDMDHPAEFREMAALRERGVIGLADSLVSCDPRYRNLAKVLLGRVLVVQDFDTASAVERKYHRSLRIVALDGTQFSAGGAISGGAFRNASNLLGRRRELEALRAEAARYRTEAENAEKEIASIKEQRNGLRAENDALGSKLQQDMIAQNTARMDAERERDKASAAAGSYEELKNENDAIGRQETDLAAEKREITDKLTASEQYEKETNERIAALQKSLQELEAEESGKSAAVAQWDLEISKVRQQADFEAGNLARIEEETRRLSEDLAEVTRSLSEDEADIAEKERNIGEIEKTILASDTAKSTSEKTLEESTARRTALAAAQKERLSRKDALQEQIAGLDKEVFRLNAKKEKLQESIDAQINYLWDEYQVTPSDAAALRDDSLGALPEMKKAAAEIRKRIRGLGPVNVGAIEEYKEVSERYNFLRTQHDDLVEAADNLQNIIAELDAGMRKTFRAQFAKINAEFDTVFREMFGGGHGTLELMEGEDILEAGVRVIAQPPGKKLVNMMQMSGGEKALTAISLLFAIQNLKPSPFCLLDEIEAALDESNVGRFADYLHKLTKHTQFIVITHRRGTMERADRLYGITMQEKGVSTLVSVNLIDKELSN